MSILMEVKNLNKKIGDLNLSDINLKIEPGYIVGLLGVNGSGKTSLIRTILNLYKKDNGIININSFSMEINEKEAKNQIGFVLDEEMFEETMRYLTMLKYLVVYTTTLMKICLKSFVRILIYHLIRS